MFVRVISSMCSHARGLIEHVRAGTFVRNATEAEVTNKVVAPDLLEQGDVSLFLVDHTHKSCNMQHTTSVSRTIAITPDMFSPVEDSDLVVLRIPGDATDTAPIPWQEAWPQMHRYGFTPEPDRPTLVRATKRELVYTYEVTAWRFPPWTAYMLYEMQAITWLALTQQVKQHCERFGIEVPENMLVTEFVQRDVRVPRIPVCTGDRLGAPPRPASPQRRRRHPKWPHTI